MTLAVTLAVRVALLVALWLLAWGKLSTANLASGLLVAAVLLIAFPSRREVTRARVRPIAVARLVLYVLGQLVPSTMLVAREVVSPRSRIRAGVIAHPLRNPSDEVANLVANIVALTPGTMTVEATRHPPVIHVHFLLLTDVAAARRSVAHLEDLAVAALGADRPPPFGDGR